MSSKESKKENFVSRRFNSLFGVLKNNKTSGKKSLPVYTDLLFLVKEACDALRPFIRAVYDELHSGGADTISGKKSDTSLFTIGDALVQEFIVNYLFGHSQSGKGSQIQKDKPISFNFKAIVGEEDLSQINVTTVPYAIDAEMKIPEKFYDQINTCKARMIELNRDFMGKLREKKTYSATIVFIDPIDATKSFVKGPGGMCTILVGFVENNRPVAGVVYRPLSAEINFALGCKRENLFVSNLDLNHTLNTTAREKYKSAAEKDRPNMITAYSEISEFIVSLGAELRLGRVRARGAGNKVLCLIENYAEIYIQDEGTFKWDICAADALIEAQGGSLFKLSGLIKGKLEKYTYDATGKSDRESIFDKSEFKEKVQVKFTTYSTNKKELVGEYVTPETEKFLKKHLNICGFVFIPEKNMKNLNLYIEAIQKVAEVTRPDFS